MSQAEQHTLGVEVWSGGVNTWECDEMGHMNVRFYVARATEGLIGLAAALGMPRAFASDATATLLVREHHIRFLREARAGAALHMRGWLVEMGETDARLMQVLCHSETGEPAATFQTLVSHVTPADSRAFPWSQEIRDRAAALAAPVPDFAAARGLSLEPFTTRASLGRADELGLVALATGAVSNQDCDVFGRMRVEQFIGRVADGIPRLAGQSRQVISQTAAAPPKRVGGAVVEYRLAYLAWPRAGDRVLIRSGLAGVDQRTQRMIHWMLDPHTGRPWGTSEAVAVTFDLDLRKIVPVSPEAQATLNATAVKGLTL